ncbi:hypothetical protein NM688_g8064 [Phlebia brevispora]|uniref:Uncharacterized protein n=1 Tax=Phlebia brevispora TaxID=194682 RepID=A0ACC1RXS9_9APHY|nr:hypothetical protein NM688_g8064 [Phlebia brevispora]
MGNVLAKYLRPTAAEDKRPLPPAIAHFPLGELPAELRSKVYKHVQSHGIATMREVSLVCHEWYQAFFPIVYETIELEAYRRDEEDSISPRSPIDEFTVLSWIHVLRSLPHISSVARSLVLKGPTSTRSCSMVIRGVAISAPRLSLCLLAALLECLPSITNIHLKHIMWEPCRTIHGDPHRAHREWPRTSLSTLQLSYIQCTYPDIAHPLMATTLFQSVDELIIEDIEGTESEQLDLPNLDIKHMCIMRSDRDSRYLSNAFYSCIPENSLQALHIHDFTYGDIHLVTPLIFRHADSLVRLHLSFISQIDLQLPVLWSILGIVECKALREFAIKINIHSRSPSHFRDMFDLLTSVLQNINSNITKLEIWFDLAHTVSLVGVQVLSLEGWSEINDICRRFHDLTHFTMGFTYREYPRRAREKSVRLDSSSERRLFRVLPFLQSLDKANISFLAELRYAM